MEIWPNEVCDKNDLLNDLGFNLCVVPWSLVMRLVVYFRVVEVIKTKVLSGQVEEFVKDGIRRSGSERYKKKLHSVLE